MPNNNTPQSWTSLQAYLDRYMGKQKDEQGNALSWQANEVRDYSPLTQAYADGRINGDQLAEGQTLLQNYLSDVQAQKDYEKAQATARNDATRAVAHHNYINTRLGSYLSELQGNSGMKGYFGLTQGQQVAVANNQANAFNTAQQTKQTALGSALESYQNALAANSKTAIDQQTTLAAARDEKQDAYRQEYQTQLEEYLEQAKIEDSQGREYITNETSNKVRDYINGLDVSQATKTKLQEYIDLKYSNAMAGADGTASTNQQTTFNDYTYKIGKVESTSDLKDNKAKIDEEYSKGVLSEEQYNNLKSSIVEKEKAMYKTSKGSGGISASNTATIAFNTKDGTFTGNDVTVTFRTGSYTITSYNNDFIKNSNKGQFFIINGKVYCKGYEGRLYAVLDYAGEGAYEKILNYLKGTCYDITM